MAEKVARTQEEIAERIAQEGVELTDEQLESISGGDWAGGYGCPLCGSDLTPTTKTDSHGNQLWYCGMCDDYFK